jgi:hypothetical protein
VRAAAIAARWVLALHLIAVSGEAYAEQSFPADPSPAAAYTPAPVEFTPLPLRRWRASFATGYEYDSGLAGDTTQQFIPFAARLEYGAFAVSVATSRVSIEGEYVVGGFSIPGLSAARLEAALARINERLGSSVTLADIADLSLDTSGVGDTLVSLSYTWFDPDRWLPFIELTTSVKLPTASAQKRIGTGETDWILQVDLAKPIGRVTPFASLAYRFNGGPISLGQRSVPITSQAVIDLTNQTAIVLDAARIPVNNSVLATVGSSMLLSDSLVQLAGQNLGLYAGVLYDFEQSPFEGVDDAHELAAYMTFDLFGRLQFGPSFLVGLSRSAPKWGIATQFLVSY